MKRAMYAIPAVGFLWSGCGGVKVEPEPAFCGDGVVDEGEQCDDGNAVDTDNCPTSCENARCNDGFIQFGVEDCDDANDVNGDDCTNACNNARCGDGIVHNETGGVETCDDANAVETDGCSAGCELDPVLRAFEITTARNVPATDVASYNLCTSYGGYGGCYSTTPCSTLFDSPLTMSMALVASGSYSRTRDCADNNFDTLVTKALSGTVEVLAARTRYRISLMEDATAVVLDCDMDAATRLTCRDAEVKTWVLEPK